VAASQKVVADRYCTMVGPCRAQRRCGPGTGRSTERSHPAYQRSQVRYRPAMGGGAPRDDHPIIIDDRHFSCRIQGHKSRLDFPSGLAATQLPKDTAEATNPSVTPAYKARSGLALCGHVLFSCARLMPPSRSISGHRTGHNLAVTNVPHRPLAVAADALGYRLLQRPTIDAAGRAVLHCMVQWSLTIRQ